MSDLNAIIGTGNSNLEEIMEKEGTCTRSDRYRYKKRKWKHIFKVLRYKKFGDRRKYVPTQRCPQSYIGFSRA